VLLEMAFLEKVVLYGNTPPLDEMHEKGLGVMVMEDAPASYAEKVVEYLSDRAKAADIGKQSSGIVKRSFTIDVMAGEYRKLYQNLKK
jgi:glycosyltransferase involved in cell wall biosynthesis